MYSTMEHIKDMDTSNMSNVQIESIVNQKVSPVTKYIFVALTAICILLFRIFGTPGLIVYGLLIFGGIAVLACSQKKTPFYVCAAFWIAVLYYAYYIIAILINGSFTTIGPPVMQFFLLTLAGFTLRSNKEIQGNITAIAKVFTIAGITMGLLSFGASAVTFFLPAFVDQLPLWLHDLMHLVKGNFPVRMTGFARNAALTAEYVYMSTCLSIFLLLQQPTRKWVLFCVANIIISTFTVFILTATRTSMLALITFIGVGYVSYLLHLFHNKDDNKFRLHLTIAISVVMIGILLFCVVMIFPQSREFFIKRVLRIDSLATGSGRLGVYVEAFHAGKGHRLFGISIDTLIQSTTLHVPHAHNNFLESLTIGGIPSLVFYTAFVIVSLVTAFRLVWRTRKLPFQESILPVFILCILASQLVYGMTECNIDRIGMSSSFYSLAIALVHIISHNHPKEKTKNKTSLNFG